MKRLGAALIALISSIALTGVLAFVGSGAAFAATCPTESAPATVAATGTSPGYTLIRGCIVSFDGTSIVYDLYEPVDASASHPVYGLLEGPGWGGGGPYTDDCAISSWAVGEDPPTAIGGDYAFLTWDPRGFGESGGVSQVDDPQAEGRDVSALIDQVLTHRPEIAVERDARDATYGQPAVGMMGGSYGGGIQLAAAGLDPRIKAIVPAWAWNDLDYSLFPGGVPKQTWFEFLLGEGVGVSTISHYASQESCDHIAGVQPTTFYDPNLYRAWGQATAAGYPDAQTLAWFAQRSMSSFGTPPAGDVPRVPTLLIQGTTDTLFNLNEAWANYKMIKAADPNVPVKMIGFCGGHAGCQYSSTPPSGFEAKVPDSVFLKEQTINWFDVYLRHDSGAVDQLPDVLLQDQTGVWHTLPSFPTAASPGPASSVSTPVSGTLVSHGAPTDANNPFTIEEYATDSNTSDPGTLTIPVLKAPASGNGVFIAGEPHVDLNVSVEGSSSELFFKLVDKGLTGACSPEPCWQGQRAVVDGQTSPIRLDNLDLANNASNPNLPPGTVHVSLDMVGVGYKLAAGSTLELQISSASAPSSSNRGAAVTTLDGSVSLPIVQTVKDQPAIRVGGDSSGAVDQRATFSAVLTKGNGDPLSGKPVDFVLGDGDLGTATTGADGVAVISTVLSGPARHTTITASFVGDDAESPTGASAPFTITKADTVTTVGAARSKGVTTASATLGVRNPSRPLAGRTIEFSLNGTVVGSAVTDASGTAIYDFGKAPKPGDDLTATYPGDESYNGSSASARVPSH